MLSDRWEAGEDVTAAVERALLGNLLMDSSLISQVKTLRPSHFLHPSRGVVFGIIASLVARNTPVTVLTVAQEVSYVCSPPHGYPGWITALSSLLDDCLPEESVTRHYGMMIQAEAARRTEWQTK